jgi:hypothetical protein
LEKEQLRVTEISAALFSKWNFARRANEIDVQPGNTISSAKLYYDSRVRSSIELLNGQKFSTTRIRASTSAASMTRLPTQGETDQCS